MVYKEVHTTMPGAFGLCSVFLPERVIVFGEPFLGIIPAMAMVHFFLKVDMSLFFSAGAEILPQPFGSLHPEAEVIGTGRRDVVGEEDGFAIGALYLRVHNIAAFEHDFGVRMIFAAFGMFYNVLVKPLRFGSDGREFGHAVAAVDVHHHGHGPQAMGGIEFAVAVLVVFGTPLRFAVGVLAEFHAAVVRGHSVVEQYATQVVFVTTLPVNEFAEHAFAYHVHHRHHVAAVTNILHHHQRYLCFLRGIHHIPAFLQFYGAAYFGAHDLAGVHGVDGLDAVPFPGRADDHGIHVVAFQQVLVIFITVFIDGGFGAFVLFENCQGLVDAALLRIGDGGDLHIFPLKEITHVFVRAEPDADHADADPVFFSGRKSFDGIGDGQ